MIKKITRVWGEDRGAVVLIIFAIVLALIGVIRIEDYGVSYDEPLDYTTFEITWEYIESSIGQILSLTHLHDTTGFLEYYDNVYGVTLRLPVYVILRDCGSERIIFLGLHLWYYLWFITAAICAFMLLRNFGFSLKLSLLGCLMYLAFPRFMAEAVYNGKDILFLSVFTISLYLGARLIKRWSFKGVFIYSLIVALGMNLRYIGAAVTFPFIMGVLLSKDIDKKIWKLLTAAITTLLIYYLITPYLWTAPLSNFINIIRSFTNNSARYVSMYFMGKQVGSNELPWYYLILWMGITIPLWVILSAVVGTIIGLKRLIKDSFKNISVRGIYILSCGLMFWGIVVADMLFHTVKYDGWRHFYFLYAFLVPVAVYGLSKIIIYIKNIKGRRIALVAIVINLALDFGWPLFIHPYSMVYMNQVGLPVMRNFETDYWLVSMTGAVRDILKETKGETKIWVGWDVGVKLLSEEERRALNIVESIYEADYVIMYDRVYRWNDIEPGKLPGFKIWKENSIFGALLYHILIPE